MSGRLSPMVSMELDDEDQLDHPAPLPLPEKPEFPYGLRICLTEKEFEKLDIDPADAFVGGIFHLHGLARITSVSSSDGNMGKCFRVEAQIEDLAIESEDAEVTDED